MTIFTCKKCGNITKGIVKPSWCSAARCDSKEFAAAEEVVAAVVPVQEPVQHLDSYMATATLRYEFGIDALGRKCQRDWTPVWTAETSAGTHDSIRDGASRGVMLKELAPREWRLT